MRSRLRRLACLLGFHNLDKYRYTSDYEWHAWCPKCNRRVYGDDLGF